MGNEKHKVDGMLIGEYVQKAIKKLFDQNKIYESDLIKLQKEDYCKIKFELNYPMFKKSNEPREYNGHARYYKDEITEGFWLTNDWYEKNWDDFLKWESGKKN